MIIMVRLIQQPVHERRSQVFCTYCIKQTTPPLPQQDGAEKMRPQTHPPSAWESNAPRIIPVDIRADVLPHSHRRSRLWSVWPVNSAVFFAEGKHCKVMSMLQYYYKDRSTRFIMLTICFTSELRQFFLERASIANRRCLILGLMQR